MNISIPNLNRDTPDKDLISIKAYRDILFLDHVLVLGKKETKNPNQVILYLAKIVADLPPDNIDDEFLYLGQGKKIIRTHTPSNKIIADNIEIGSDLNLIFGVNLDFAINDSFEPQYVNQYPRKFINKSGKLEDLFYENEYGKLVYRKIKLKTVEEIIPSNYITVKPQSKFNQMSLNEYDFDFPDDNPYEHIYEEFNGIYGLDDETINSAFEGDPENYWNID